MNGATVDALRCSFRRRSRTRHGARSRLNDQDSDGEGEDHATFANVRSSPDVMRTSRASHLHDRRVIRGKKHPRRWRHHVGDDDDQSELCASSCAYQSRASTWMRGGRCWEHAPRDRPTGGERPTMPRRVAGTGAATRGWGRGGERPGVHEQQEEHREVGETLKQAAKRRCIEVP